MNTSHTIITSIGLLLALGAGGAWAAASCDVRLAQQALEARGIDTGRVDGVIGPVTRRAVREFQSTSDLTASGALDEPTCNALLTPAASTAAAPAQQQTVQDEGTNSAATSAKQSTEKQQSQSAEPAAPSVAQAVAEKADSAAMTKAATATAATSATPESTESVSSSAVSSSVTDSTATSTQVAKVAPIQLKKPTNPLTTYRTAFGLLKGGVHAPAAEMFEDFLSANPAHDRVPDAYYWLGDAYAALGKNGMARDVWTKVIAAFPDHRYAPKAADRLKDLP